MRCIGEHQYEMCPLKNWKWIVKKGMGRLTKWLKHAIKQSKWQNQGDDDVEHKNNSFLDINQSMSC